MKKFLSSALALLMVCVMLPVVALAADTLPAAVNGVITMVEDTTLVSDATFTSGNTTIDLGGKTLTGTINVAYGANVTIKNGKMIGGQVINVFGTTSGDKTTLTIESDVEISAPNGYGVCIFGEGTFA